MARPGDKRVAEVVSTREERPKRSCDQPCDKTDQRCEREEPSPLPADMEILLYLGANLFLRDLFLAARLRR